MPAANELIAHQRTEHEIQEEIGADWLVYQDLDDLIAAARDGNPEITHYEDSVFSGQYIAGDVSPAYLTALEDARHDAAAARKDTAASVLED